MTKTNKKPESDAIVGTLLNNENREFPTSHAYNLLLANQKFFRGEILALTVAIERQIDNYISQYFCADTKKSNELNELLLYTEKITLDMKRQIFTHLLKKNNSQFLKAHPDFLKYLEEIVPHRNVFAHLEVIDIRDLEQMDKKKLVFKKYSNGVMKPKKYTIDDIADLQTKMIFVDFSMGVILQELPPLPDSLATKS